MTARVLVGAVALVALAWLGVIALGFWVFNREAPRIAEAL